MTSPERLAVSTQGMRELHAGRAPWSLAKELIQNSWDESPEATVCTVEVKPLVKGRKEERSRTVITVTDDGPGFADIRDAYTLMGSTPKRGDPAKRGRFNVGEKEIISVATEATIATVGRTVVFPASGGREVKRNRRKRGTEVTVVMPWSVSKRQELVDMLRRFRPTDCRLVVNGDEVPRREPVVSRRATLATVLQSGPGEPVRSTHGYQHAHTHGYQHAHTHGYQHAHTRGYQHAHTRANGHAHTHGYQHADTLANGHAHTHGYQHADTLANGHAHAHAHTHGYQHTHTHSDANL